MAENIINQFLEVQTASNWTETKQKEVDANGQIVFVPGDVNAIYAKGKNYGDGALSSKTLLTEEITIEGGPLASDAVKGAFEGGVIPAGTDLQELLKALLCVEIWSKTISKQNPRVTVANVAPKITGITNNGIYEVGTNINITVALQQTSVSNTSAKISGFEYGMSYNDKEYKGSSYSKREVSNIIKYDNDHYAGRCSYSIAANGTMSSETLWSSTSDANLAVNGGSKSFTVTTYVGDKNKLTGISAYSKGLSYYNAGISNTYDMSNLGGVSETAYSISSVGTASSYYEVTKDRTEKSASVTWVGAYPIYFNGTKYTDSNSDGVEIDATSVAASDTFIKSNELFVGSKSLFVKFPKQDANSWKIAIPEHYSAATISAKAFDGLVSKKYSIGITFSKTSKKGVASCGTGGAIQYSYYIWEATGTSGANGVQLTINLK